MVEGRRGLGRGLSALLGEADAAAVEPAINAAALQAGSGRMPDLPSAASFRPAPFPLKLPIHQSPNIPITHL